jgi:hypothetical protein
MQASRRDADLDLPRPGGPSAPIWVEEGVKLASRRRSNDGLATEATLLHASSERRWRPDQWCPERSCESDEDDHLVAAGFFAGNGAVFQLLVIQTFPDESISTLVLRVRPSKP